MAGAKSILSGEDFASYVFSNDDVFSNLDGVMDTIVNELATPTPNPSPQGGGAKCAMKLCTRRGGAQ